MAEARQTYQNAESDLLRIGVFGKMGCTKELREQCEGNQLQGNDFR
jgi:hypothetical protein